MLRLATQATHDQAPGQQQQRSSGVELPVAIRVSGFSQGGCYFANFQAGGKQIDNFARLDGDGQRVFASLRQGGGR